jgi:hypothetical protein
MRELGRRSGEARRRKRDQQLEPLTDREQAMAALRRALDGNNRAAMVAAAKALIEQDRTPQAGPMSVEDARAELNARLDAIVDHRRRYGKTCQACEGSGLVLRARGGEGPGKGVPGV